MAGLLKGWFSAHRQGVLVLQQDGARRRGVADIHNVQCVLRLSEPQQQGVQRLMELLQEKSGVRGGEVLAFCAFIGAFPEPHYFTFCIL